MRSSIVTWVRYGGRAWLPDVGSTVEIPERVYPVVDVIADNLGTGLLVRSGGLDFVIDASDMHEEAE